MDGSTFVDMPGEFVDMPGEIYQTFEAFINNAKEM